MSASASFQDKSILISGGTSGINLGIAKVFAARGANVAVFGRDPDKAKAAAAEIEAEAGRAALGLSADVRIPDAVNEVIGSAHAAHGPFDVVIAGAAGNFVAPAVDISPKGFRTVVDIDLLGTYNVFRLAYEKRNSDAASFIAITAPQAVNPTAFQAHVCAAKAGINMLVKCLALEWGQAGVRVNGISPGPIADTEGMRRLAPTPEATKMVEERNPLRRFGRVDEIGEMAAFLSSPEASYVTGTILNCDGGTELGAANMDMITPRR
jgi:NAD(P)-dependent dehydrogenase (short-subunit alcohol dehydrogenase family)